jgi:hypothetical protein
LHILVRNILYLSFELYLSIVLSICTCPGVPELYVVARVLEHSSRYQGFNPPWNKFNHKIFLYFLINSSNFYPFCLLESFPFYNSLSIHLPYLFVCLFTFYLSTYLSIYINNETYLSHLPIYLSTWVAEEMDSV